MEITVKIEGLDGLNQAIVMLANALQANALQANAQPLVVAPQYEMVAPIPTTAYIQTAPTAPVTPTTEATYTWDDLALACNNVINAGKHDTVIAVLAEFGINALTELTPQSYGAFMARLRLMSGVNV